MVNITVAIVETGALSEKMGYDRGNYQYCVVVLTGVKYSLTENACCGVLQYHDLPILPH